MKKIFLIIIVLLTLQSCSINNAITFHTDSTISTDIVLDMSEMIAMEGMAKQGENSLKNLNMPDFPKEWQSIYDFQKSIGKDSIPAEYVDILKRATIKGLFKDNKEVGFQLRFSRFSPEQYDAISALADKGGVKNNSLNFPSFKWDGKELHLNMKAFEKISDEEEQMERFEQMKKMFNIELHNTLTFEGKIKKIKGKHPYIEKVDAHTIKIDLKSSKKKKRRDNEIVIITR